MFQPAPLILKQKDGQNNEKQHQLPKRRVSDIPPTEYQHSVMSWAVQVRYPIPLLEDAQKNWKYVAVQSSKIFETALPSEGSKASPVCPSVNRNISMNMVHWGRGG